jgi:hypothetical protein
MQEITVKKSFLTLSVFVISLLCLGDNGFERFRVIHS